jgi:ribosomal protein S18 acetylase RimI-like enzyme
MITTRLATLAELELLAKLFDAYRQFYEQKPDLDLARRFIQERMERNESVVLIAADVKDEVVGFCQLYPTFCSVEAKPIFSLYDLYVAPSAQRTGAGKALLKAAEKLAVERGMARMDLTTAKANKTAQAAYDALGWVRDEVFYSYSKRVEVSPLARAERQR